MDSTIWIGIAVGFLDVVLTVGTVLVALKLLHHAFEWEDAWERKNYPEEYYRHRDW